VTSVPKSVPSSVANSAANSVAILTRPQLGPYQPMSGSSINPVVPKTEVEGEPSPQPHFQAQSGKAAIDYQGSSAPSVPRDGFLFRAPPIDEHYRSEIQPHGNPNGTVGRPGTLGWWTRIQQFQNNIGLGVQNREATGWNNRAPQQRTSVMRNALPPHGQFGTQTFQPTPQPQAARFNRITPSIGTDPYGSGVLNADTFGAGQTAGGIGGNQYTPAPGPPTQTSTAGSVVNDSMPVWG
jgi:hypothetical protein